MPWRRGPDIDASRAGVLGGSYGGLHDRVARGASWRAFPRGDQRARRLRLGQPLGTSDIGHTMTSMVGTDPAKWPAQTPLALCGQDRIPLLILHWEGDLRVPFEQAQRLFAALRARRAPVELIVFPAATMACRAPARRIIASCGSR